MRISDWSSDVCSSDLTTERSRHLMERPRREHEGGACPVDFLTHLPARLPIDIEVLERERECPVDMPVADVLLRQDFRRERHSNDRFRLFLIISGGGADGVFVGTLSLGSTSCQE